MKKTTLYLWLIPVVILFAAFPAMADWINLSGAQSAANIAEIYVEDDHVRVVLEVYVNDIDKFIDLLPDEWLQQSKVKPPPMQERMRRFSTDGFQVIIGDQQRLM